MKNNILKELKKNWKKFIESKENKPYRGEDCGIRYPGKVCFEHYIFWSLLRGKDPASSSHDVLSKSYSYSYKVAKVEFDKKDKNSRLFKVFLGENLKIEDLEDLLN